MLAVARLSIKDAVENAQEPTGRGGRMRVDTGFLRASGRASVNGWPSGNSVRPKDAKPGQFTYNGEQIDVTLAKLKIGDTFHFGWVANYAEYRELYDGFMEASLQHWSKYVTFNTDFVRRRVERG